MGYNLADFSPKAKACIAESELKFKYQASPEAVAKDAYDREKKLHEDFIQWLNLKNLIIDHDRMDRKNHEHGGPA